MEEQVNVQTVETIGTAAQEMFGAMVYPANAFMSKAAASIEKSVCKYDAITLQAELAKYKPALTKKGVPILSSPAIAQYRLTDYYLLSEGDIWQTIQLPLELSARPLRFRSKDKGAEEEIKEVFSELGLYQFLLDMQLCIEKYGVCYPFEVWDGGVPVHLSLLNPMHIAIGTVDGFGTRPLWLSSPAGFDQHLTSLPEPIRKALTGGKEDKVQNSMMFELGSDVCTQVRDWCLPWEPYPVAPLTRAFRTISLRQTLEEMVKATVEGYKSQLWLFLLGDMTHPPGPGEMTQLVSAVSGQSGDRTGHLVWRGNLKVEQHTPKSLDSALGNELKKELTQHIMRQRGISLRMMDGEVNQAAARNAPSPLDIKVFLERLKYRRSRVEDWLNGYIKRYFEKNNHNLKKGDVPHSAFADITIAIEERIRNVLLPLFGVGALSNETLLEDSQVSSYEIETTRKKAERKDAELFGPRPTFAQQTVNPNTPAKTTVQQIPGRPDGSENKNEAAYHDELQSAYETFRASRDASAFGSSLKEIGNRYLRSAYEGGYSSAGGATGVDETRVFALQAWHSHYLSGFIDDIDQAIQANDENKLSQWQGYRLGLYAAGERQGYTYGLFQARREQGYSGWSRLVGDNCCADCKNDSKQIHNIGEEWFELHPGGNCKGDFVMFYRGKTSSMPSVLPALGLSGPEVTI